jgi:hypothetical protein
MRLPWSDWIPGVLSKRQVLELCHQGYLLQTGSEPSVDHSSIDLHLFDEGWELPLGSIKPSGRSYLHFVEQHELSKKLSSSGGMYQLNPRTTYLFRIRERLGPLRGSGIYGQATAKSSVGRLDVLARLVVDGSSRYEGSSDELGQSSGEMFLEITLMTFPIRIKEGTSLSQLRLFYGEPEACEVRSRERGTRCYITLIVMRVPRSMACYLWISRQIGGRPEVASSKRRRTDRSSRCNRSLEERVPSLTMVALEVQNAMVISGSNQPEILLHPAVAERLRLPSGVAAYCRAIDGNDRRNAHSLRRFRPSVLDSPK